MNTSLLSWFVIVIALLAASLPFFTERLFGLTTIKFRKTVWLRLFELVVLYFLVGLLGTFLEAQAGNRFEQRWEFFAITACLFVVFAFPGFVYRYLRKQSFE